MEKENKMSKGQNLRAKGKKLRAKGKKWFGSLLRRRILVIVFLLLQIFFIGYYLIAHTMASEIIRNILFVFSIAVVIHVISKNDVGAYRLIWVFLILLFPVLGGILYVMVRFQSSTKRFEPARIINSLASERMLFFMSRLIFAVGSSFVPNARTTVRPEEILEYSIVAFSPRSSTTVPE